MVIKNKFGHKVRPKEMEVLTIDDLDTLEDSGYFLYRTFIHDNRIVNLKRARKFAEKTKGIFFTQVDYEINNERIYAKGYHYVNRTGVYMVLYKYNPSRRY